MLNLAPYLLAIIRIAAGLLFLQHGAEKLWGFDGGRIDHNFPSLHALAGPIEVIGGVLLVVGFATRITSFILCGEMAVAYFMTWAPSGFVPISNGGEEAVLFCFLFLWLVARGAGPWSLDVVIEERRARATLKQKIQSWELQTRALLRIVLGFVLLLHGLRIAYAMFPKVVRRVGAPAMPLDALPTWAGYIAIVCGALLMLGFLTRWAAGVLAIESLAAYVFIAAPRAAIPVRAGANEVILYTLVFLYLALEGAGTWSVDGALPGTGSGRSQARPL